MSIAYKELNYTQFPNRVDDFEDSMDMPADDAAAALIEQYKTLIEQKKYQDAQALVEADGTGVLRKTLITAKDINQIKHGLMAIERMWTEDLHYFVDGMGYQGEINTLSFEHSYDAQTRTHNFVPLDTYEDVKQGVQKPISIVGAVVNGRCKVTAGYTPGDTFTVNGKAVSACVGSDVPDDDTLPVGRWIGFIYDDNGAQLNFKNGGGLTKTKLAAANATPSDVCEGVGFYAKDKTLKHGTMTLLHDSVTPDKVLDGTTYHGGANTATQVGTMPNNGAVQATVKAGDTAVIPKGYHDGEGYVQGESLQTQTAGDAAAQFVLKDKSCWVNGNRVVGTMPNNGAWRTVIEAGKSVNVPQGYHSGSGIVTAKPAWDAAVGHGAVLIHNDEECRLPAGRYRFVAGVGGVYNEQAEDRCICKCFLGSLDNPKWTWEQPVGILRGMLIVVDQAVTVGDGCEMKVSWSSEKGSIGAFFSACPIAME